MHNGLRKIPYFSDIKKTVLDGGFDAWFVGGCVRDIILGRDVHDVDLVCFSHDYKDFARAVKKAVPSVWVEFKDNIRLVRGRVEIDISKARGETLTEDLAKRDFTINNLAMDTGGNITGDASDLDQGIIRHVSEATFTDDPLRILRAFRFRAQLGFRLADSTLSKIKAEKHLLKASPCERIYGEMDKLFCGSHAGEALKELTDTGVYQVMTGGIEPHITDIPAAETGRGLVFFAATVFSRVGLAGQSLLAERLNLSNAMRKKAIKTAVFAEKAVRALKGESDNDIRKLIYSYPDVADDGLKLYEIFSEAHGADRYSVEASVDRAMTQLKYVDFDTPEKLNGVIMQEIGVAPGPMMGRIIKEVRPLMASGELGSLEAAEKYIKEKYL